MRVILYRLLVPSQPPLRKSERTPNGISNMACLPGQYGRDRKGKRGQDLWAVPRLTFYGSYGGLCGEQMAEIWTL